MNKAELLIEYAKAWNELDISYIKPILAKDFTYTSQWVFETMHGSDRYIEYLTGKFNAIRNTATFPVAELGYFKTAYLNANEPCIILTQQTPEALHRCAILIETENGLITEGNMVGVPAPNEAILFGILPDKHFQ